MGDHPRRGSVTPISSIFSAEDAEQAAKRVQETISEHEREIHRLSHFSAENKALINLVQRLPDELSHEIMVPFGKAAFFPGRLIHTNEFLVLLGENYHVERTAKQTVEILQRRGKTLDSQVESLRAMIMDLDAEAKFFSSTAEEAKEGLVEIREDYMEDIPSGSKTESGSAQISDEEYAQIMSRLDELETEEKAAESASAEKNEEADRINIGPSSPMEKSPAEEHPLSDVAPIRDHYRQAKAFTGSIIERTPVAPPEAQLTTSSKPVSRFKMRRSQN